MTEGTEIYYALSSTALGVGLTFEAFRRFGMAKLIKNTPTSKISELTDGYREVSGRITKGKSALKAPMSGKQCVFYSFRVTEGSDAGENGNERTLIHDNKRVRCSIYDGTGSADIAVAHDWWTPEGFLRFLSGDFHVRENEASTSFIQC